MANRRIEEGENFDVALVDARESGNALLDCVASLCAASPDLAVVALMPDPDPDIALRTIRAGAQDTLVESDATRHVVQRVLRRAVERHRCEAHLRDAILRDELTCLLNRRGMMKALTSSMKSKVDGTLQACTLLTLDLDDFTAINDRFGGGARDDLLVESGRRILGSVRSCDHVARTDGDEFVVVLPRVRHRDAVLAIVKNLTEAMAEPIELGGRNNVHVSTSIGISTCPIDEDTHHMLVKCSNQALCEAKRRGGNQHVFYRDIIREAAARRSQLSPEALGLPALSSLSV